MNKQEFLNRMARGKASKKYGIPYQNVCPVCFGIMRDEWENTGFEENPHNEVVGVKCLSCGYSN